jgi:hypothetical protein
MLAIEANPVEFEREMVCVAPFVVMLARNF